MQISRLLGRLSAQLSLLHKGISSMPKMLSPMPGVSPKSVKIIIKHIFSWSPNYTLNQKF